MSLVDYASSDDETEKEQEEEGDASARVVDKQVQHSLHPSTSSSASTAPLNLHHHQSNTSLQPQSSVRQSQDVSLSFSPPFEKLPDASMLLSSPLLSNSVGTDHSARVAAAMAENASRQREANGSSSSSIRGKIPRGNLLHSKNIPDTSSGTLTPPQLRGRSNVVTEDISKLFVQRNSKEKS